MDGLVENQGWSYRAHLDGIRAVAVALVVAFHAGIGHLRGGFIGVDVFFVLSGYLVTHVLLTDLGRNDRVQFGRFYARRARRLLPAAALNLIVTAVVFSAIAAPAELSAARASIRSAALYFSNWHFITQSADYFAADVSSSPVIHYWSLSVEEQFYLLWPLALAAVVGLARRAGAHGDRLVRTVVAGAGIASVLAAVSLSRGDLNRAYYGTDTRAYQLLAGAMVALTPGIIVLARRLPKPDVSLPAISVGMIVALGAAATSFVDRGPIIRGVLATVITVLLIVSLEASPGGAGRRLLSVAPLVYLGKISYGTYLWHWLVIVVIARQLDLAAVTTFLVTLPLAAGLAALSYELLERPVRLLPTLDRLRVPVIATGLALSLLVGLVVAPWVLDRGRGRPAAEQVSAGADIDAGAVAGVANTTDWQSAFDDTYSADQCPPSVDRACRLATGSGPTAMVVGESHAAMFIPMLTEVAKAHDVSLWGGLMSYCPWTRGMHYKGVGGNPCFDDQARMFDQIIPEVDPDIVFLAHRPIDDQENQLAMVDQDEGPITDRADLDVQLGRRIRAVVADLRRDGRTVVLLEPVPPAPKDANPLTCLSETIYLEQCRHVSSVEATPEEQVYRNLAASDDHVLSINFDPQVCPYLPICDPVVNNLVVMRDDNHLTIRFATSLAPWFAGKLRKEGILGQ